jgi:hypothetical protein
MLTSYFSGSPAVTQNAASLIDRVKPALATIKAALDERDSWETLAGAHEAEEIKKMNRESSKPVRFASGTRGGTGAGGKTQRVNRKDLKMNPRNNFKVPTKIPGNIGRSIVWDMIKLDLSVIAPNSGAIVETNYGVTLAQLPQSSSWIALFDQFCIVQMSITFESLYWSGDTTAPTVLHTAIDFDNTTNLGSIPALDSFASSQRDILGVGKVVTRSCRPCIKGRSQGTDNVEVQRSWLDCGTATSIAHFGFRSIMEIATAYNVNVYMTVYVAFRNEI